VRHWRGLTMPKVDVGPIIVPFFISHRGCPHQCVFCDQRTIAGSDGSFPSAHEIQEKIARYSAARPGSSVVAAFYGGSFTCLSRQDQLRLLKPLQPLLAVGKVASIRLSTRPDAIDSDVLTLLRSMGVQTVELGVQAMDDDILIDAGRGHTVNDVVRAADVLRDYGFSFGVQLMPGLPGDDRIRSLRSLSRALALRPAFLRIYPTIVLAGTPLAEHFMAGAYQPLTLQAAVTLCKIMLHRCLQANVPIIRMGLQPTADLDNAGVVLAGPYHPAFRQLVESELCYDLVVALLGDGKRTCESVTITCSPSRIADVVGQRRANSERLLREHGVRLAAVRADARLNTLELNVAGPAKERRGTILKDLHYA
jgi:histone acetyltransferase (RNA polymerase elongator complex component)